MPRPPKETAIKRLQLQAEVISELKLQRHDSPAFTEWKRNTENAITYTFPEMSRHIKDFQDVDYDPHIALVYNPRDPTTSRYRNEDRLQQAYIRGLDSAAAILRSMITEVQEYWPPDDAQGPSSPETPSTPRFVNTNRVFLIHGRDHGTRDTVTRFLEGLELKPVILEEQPNRGRTVIEKFEEYVQGDFAVAILTPDDVGGLSNEELQPRARQNVIFEFGYCIGKFGRGRVFALVKGEPEIPSDYSGVLYIPLDEHGGWKMELIREMKSAGLDIDANRAYE